MIVKKPPASGAPLLANAPENEEVLCDVATDLVELQQLVIGLNLPEGETVSELSKSLELAWVAATRLAVELKMERCIRDIAALSGSPSSIH